MDVFRPVIRPEPSEASHVSVSRRSKRDFGDKQERTPGGRFALGVVI